jgi:hypothetical protein
MGNQSTLRHRKFYAKNVGFMGKNYSVFKYPKTQTGLLDYIRNTHKNTGIE